MDNRELKRQLQALNDLLDKTSDASSGSIELQAHWARYICVRVSGFLEIAIKEIYSDLIKKSSSPKISNYACNMITQVRNPNSQKFIEIAGMFEPTWREELEKYMSDNGRLEAINSIISNRHLIVHGKDSGITLARLKDYLMKSIEVIEYIEAQCV